jgi:hypothetical protein
MADFDHWVFRQRMASRGPGYDAALSAQDSNDVGELPIRMDVSASSHHFQHRAAHFSSANCANFQILFYLPIYFQSVKGDSAIMSGVYTLPLVSFYALGAILSGLWISKTRHPVVAEIISPLLALVGTVLFYYMDINTSKAWYTGAQVPFGLGIGFGNQVPVTALQAFAKPSEVAATVGILFSQYRFR